MFAGGFFIWYTLFFVVLLSISLSTSKDNAFILDDYCGRRISVSSCQDDYHAADNGRFVIQASNGKMMFWNISAWQRCDVILEFQDCSEPISIYSNILESNLANDAFVDIVEHNPYTNHSTPLKKLFGGKSGGNDNPLSVGQFQTAFSNQPSIVLSYHAAQYDQQYQVVFTWTVVYGNLSNTREAAFCIPLNGYVNRTLLCDTSHTTTATVACPGRFVPNVNLGNPVQSIDRRACEDKSSMHVVFADEFTEQRLNTSKWNTPTIFNENEIVTPRNIRTDNGTLKILLQENNGTFSVGQINTQDKFTFRYGDVEIRARLPSSPRLLMWTFYSLQHPQCNGSGDSSYCQHVVHILWAQSNFPHRTDAEIVMDQSNSSGQWSTFHEQDMTAGFHVYKLSWTQDALVWYVDKREIKRVTDPQLIPHHAMQLFLSTSAAAQFGTKQEDAEAELWVDYIIVRQKGQPLIEAVRQKHEPLSNEMAVLVSGIAVLLLLVVLLLTVWVWRRRHSRKIHNLLFSTSILPTNAEVSLNGKYNIPQWKQLTDVLEMSKSDLHFDKGILGSGEYGLVRKAVASKLIGFSKPVVVAVKSIKDPSDEHQHRLLMEELLLHAKIGRHLNIVNLLGAVTTGELLLVLEFCRFGSLLSYLRSSKPDCKPDKSYVTAAFANPVYIQFRKDKSNKKSTLSEKELMTFAYQISRGMEYLSQHSVIHRDLAARNVLVAEDGVVKICDFGLAKQKCDYYAMNSTTVALPVRWLSPECIRTKIFSEKTDVWAFGVTMWEIFSFGRAPFSDAVTAQWDIYEFVEALNKGFQLEQPDYCSNDMYDIIQSCWNLDPTERPAFKSLCYSIGRLLQPEVKSQYLTLDTPYLNYNVLHRNS